MPTQKEIVLLGAGGHASVVLDALKKMNGIVRGILDSDPKLVGSEVLRAKVLGNDDFPFDNEKDLIFVNAIGELDLREKITGIHKSKGRKFLTIHHPFSSVGLECDLGEGVQIMAGAVLQPYCRIGEQTIVNTRASIDHHSIIGRNCHISPGAILCGEVEVGDSVQIGAGATILPGIKVGSDVIIGAGAVVTKDVPAGKRILKGVPAK